MGYKCSSEPFRVCMVIVAFSSALKTLLGSLHVVFYTWYPFSKGRIWVCIVGLWVML